MRDADADGRVRTDCRGHYCIAQYPDAVGVREELERRVVLEVVGRAPARERNRTADHAISAADEFVLLAGKPVGKQQEDLVLAGQLVHRARHLLAGGTLTSSNVQRGTDANLESVAANDANHHRGLGRTCLSELSDTGTPDKGGVTSLGANAIEHRPVIHSRRAEHHDERCLAASKCFTSRLRTRRPRVAVAATTRTEPARPGRQRLGADRFQHGHRHAVEHSHPLPPAHSKRNPSPVESAPWRRM